MEKQLRERVEKLVERLNSEADDHERMARIMEAGNADNVTIGQRQIVAAQRRYAAVLLRAALADTRPEPPAEGERSPQLQSAIDRIWPYKGYWKNAVCFMCHGESGQPPSKTVDICERCYADDVAASPVSPLSEEQVLNCLYMAANNGWNVKQAVSVKHFTVALNAALGTKLEGKHE